MNALVPAWRVPSGRECRFCGENRASSMKKNRKCPGGVEKCCKACASRENRRWRKDDPKRATASRRRDYEKNSDRYRANSGAHYRENREQVRELQREYYLANRDAAIAKASKWARDNPELRREAARSYSHRRRAIVAGAEAAKFSAREVFEDDSYQCYLCGVVTDPNVERWHPRKTVLEHRTPIARGGAHTRENCATACWGCNSVKATMTEAEFRARRLAPEG